MSLQNLWPGSVYRAMENTEREDARATSELPQIAALSRKDQRITAVEVESVGESYCPISSSEARVVVASGRELKAQKKWTEVMWNHPFYDGRLGIYCPIEKVTNSGNDGWCCSFWFQSYQKKKLNLLFDGLVLMTGHSRCASVSCGLTLARDMACVLLSR